MKKIISISEAMQIPKGTGHVLAIGDSFYNEDKGEMKVTQPGNQEIEVEGFDPQTIKMKISLEEAIPATKDIFHSWIKRILKNRTGHSRKMKGKTYANQI